MLSKAHAAALRGIEAVPVEVEVDVSDSGNQPHYTIVGLPDAAVKESLERVKSALKNCGFQMPFAPLTVNLAPADLKKEGTAFDLPIALGILACQNIFPAERLAEYVIVGELALDGRTRPVRGALSISRQTATRDDIAGLLIPEVNAMEAALVEGVPVYPIGSLPEAVEFLSGLLDKPAITVDRDKVFSTAHTYQVDMSEVRGQAHVKRAVEVAAAGGHNVILVGTPGAGKTMIARRIPTILPPMSFSEAIETTTVHSVAGHTGSNGFTATRPFRSPHHTISHAGLIGGGTNPSPGEVSLAHNGVLFLDELPEFQRNVLEVLRQPLEDGFVTISRVAGTLEFPSRFMLIAAMNPCPCGFKGDPDRSCTCTEQMIVRYRSKISGPLMDRLDLHIGVPSVKYREISAKEGGESSQSIRKRVIAARMTQNKRFRETGLYCNAQMSQRHIEAFCDRTEPAEQLLAGAFKKLNLTARAYSRILKVARTIADLDAASIIEPIHISEAINYRMLDRS